MKVEELYNAPKYAGIYLFKNKINGKCYIGQAVKLRKRLLHHLSNFRCDRYDAPLYRAFKKYGLENFELSLIETFKGNVLSKEIKDKLNELEIKYIKEYNSYGATGYNQTLGGDPGVLGYKMTDSQKDRIRNSIKEVTKDGKYMIYIYDIKDKYYYTFVNSEVASQILNIPSYNFRHFNYFIIAGKYIIARTKEELEEKINSFKNKKDKIRTGDYKGGVFKLSKEEFLRVYNLNISNTEKSNMLRICKKTYYNYLKYFNLDFNTPLKKNKAIIQYTLEHAFIKEWKSAAKASRDLNLSNASAITKCCKHKSKTAYGYMWEYK